MKKKWPLLLFMTMCLTAVGAFYYTGAPKPTLATPTENKQITDGIVEKPKEIVEKSPEEISTEVSNEKKLVEQDENSYEIIIEDGQKPFIYLGYEYWRLTHSEEYPRFNYLVELAEMNGLELYAIKYSDVKILVKNGEVVGHLSVNGFSIIPEEINFAKSYFSHGNSAMYEKLIPNIDIVLEHDVKVTVSNDEMDLVTIYKDDGFVYFYIN